jgi:hypothetical protein
VPRAPPLNRSVRPHNADTAQIEAHAPIRRIPSRGEPHERQDVGAEEVLRGRRLLGRTHLVVERERGVFNARSLSVATLERRAEKAMQAELGHSFATIARSAEYLQNRVQSEPFTKFSLPSTAKRVITFLRRPAEPKLRLPIEQDGASILAFTGSEVLAAYLPSPKGPVFMRRSACASSITSGPAPRD